MQKSHDLNNFSHLDIRYYPNRKVYIKQISAYSNVSEVSEWLENSGRKATISVLRRRNLKRDLGAVVAEDYDFTKQFYKYIFRRKIDESLEALLKKDVESLREAYFNFCKKGVLRE